MTYDPVEEPDDEDDGHLTVFDAALIIMVFLLFLAFACLAKSWSGI